MARRAALPSLLAAALLAVPPAFAGDQPDGGTGRRAAEDARPSKAGAGTAKGPADAGSADPDQEIIEHLDELQQMELLENLELFDPKAEEEK